MSVVLNRRNKPSWTFTEQDGNLVHTSRYGNRYVISFNGMTPVVSRQVGTELISNADVRDTVRPVSLSLV
jgi:hypothetical protein